jgi:hypothetical protein
MASTAATKAKNLNRNLPDPRVESIIREAWSKASASGEGWSNEVPEAGQAEVTVLSVQDFFGGSIISGVVNGIQHYWNILQDGTTIDLTRAQFVEPVEVLTEQEIDRSNLMNNPNLRRRYNDFDERVSELV